MEERIFCIPHYTTHITQFTLHNSHYTSYIAQFTFNRPHPVVGASAGCSLAAGDFHSIVVSGPGWPGLKAGSCVATCLSLTIVAVMKMRRSILATSFVSRLNAAPMSGMSPKMGRSEERRVGKEC